MRSAATASVLLLLLGSVEAPRAHSGTETPQAPRDTEGGVQVMSWNILHKGWEKEGHASWEKRIPNVVRMLREEHPDVVGLQEESKQQVAYLTKALPGYRYLPPYKSKGGGLLIRSDAWRVMNSGRIPIPGKRYASWALLESTRDGERWMFYNAHLIHRTAAGSAALRMEGAKHIAAHVAAQAPPGVPVIFTGDFNALSDMPVMKYLTGDSGSPSKFFNAFDLLHGADDPRGTWRGLGTQHHGERIDHILFNTHAGVDESNIIDYDALPQPWPSDHYPVQATFHTISREDLPHE